MTTIQQSPTVPTMPKATDPDAGKPEWVMRYLNWMYQSCVSSMDYQTMMSRMYEERLYGTGAQNARKYMPKMGIRDWFQGPSQQNQQSPDPSSLRLASGEMTGGGTNSSDTSYISIDWRIVPVLPKVLSIITEKVVKRGYFVNVSANDPESQNKKLREKMMQVARMYASKLQTAEVFNQSAGAEVIPPDPEAAQSMEEIEQNMESFRLAEEEAYEVAINAVLGENRFEEQYRVLAQNMVMHNMGIGLERSDGKGRVVTEIVDPLRAIYDMGSANYCARHFGHVIPMTPSALREFAGRFGKKWSDDEFADVVKMALSASPSRRNYWWNARPQEYYESWRSNFILLGPQDSQQTIYVMYGTFYSNVPQRYDIREKNGQKKAVLLTKEVMDSEAETYTDEVTGKKMKRHREYPNATERVMQYVYEGYMILGTNQNFGCQMLNDMTRSVSPEKFAMTTLPYKLGRASIEQSICRDRIPQADGIQILFLQRQKFEQQLAAAGVSIHTQSVIEGFSAKDGTPEKAWRDFLAMYFQLNSSLHNAPNGSTQPPIAPIPARGLVELMQLDQIILMRIQEMEGTAGLNAATSGATPDSKALVGTYEFAAQSTDNALEHVVKACIHTTERLCEGIAGRLQVFARTNGLSKYTMSINDLKRKTIIETANNPLIELGFRVEANPNTQMMDGFYRNLEAYNLRYKDSNGADGIPPDVYLRILQCKSVAQQVSILERTLRKVRKEAQEREAASIQANQQAQMQSSQMAEQSKQQTLQMEYGLKGQHEQLVGSIRQQELAAQQAHELRAKQAELETEIIVLDRQMAAEASMEVRKAMEQRKTVLLQLLEQRRTDLLLADKRIEEMKARPKPQTASK